MGIIRSLDAATSTGAGIVLMFDEPPALHGAQSITTGSPMDAVIVIEGTIDGSTWYEIGTISPNAYSTVVNSPLAGIRANLTTLDGGTSPTVTVWIASR
jgi:hypothetical protein